MREIIKLKRLLIFVVFFNCIVAIGQTPPSDPSWTQVFSDDFPGSSIDATKWKVFDDWDQYGHVECYRAGNTTVSGGNLAMNLKYEHYQCMPCTLQPGGFQDHYWTSSMVELKSAYNFKYGYMEARVNIPYLADSRLWPAFWTALKNGLAGPYSSRSEIQVFEQLQVINPTGNEVYQDDNILGANVIFNYGTTSPCTTATIQPQAQLPLSSSYTGWHTYAVEWSAKAITWYFDGSVIWKIDNPAPGSYDGSSCDYVNYYNNGHYGGGAHDLIKIILDLAYQGSDNTINQTMYVDYVKVYQLQADCSTTVTGSGSNKDYDFTKNLPNSSSVPYDNKVKSSIDIGGTTSSGTITFPANPTISLRAVNSITLGAGFNTPSNATIYIDVPGCPY